MNTMLHRLSGIILIVLGCLSLSYAMTNFPFNDTQNMSQQKRKTKATDVSTPKKTAVPLFTRKPKNTQEQFEQEILQVLEEIKSFADKFSRFPLTKEHKSQLDLLKKEQQEKDKQAKSYARSSRAGSRSRSSRGSSPFGGQRWARSGSGGNMWDWGGGSRSGRSRTASLWDSPGARDRSYNPLRQKSSPQQRRSSKEKDAKGKNAGTTKIESQEKDREKDVIALYNETVSSIATISDFIKKYDQRAQNILSEGFFSKLDQKNDDLDKLYAKLKNKLPENTTLEAFDKKHKSKLQNAHKTLTQRYKQLFENALFAATDLTPFNEKKNELIKEQQLGRKLLETEFRKAIGDTDFNKKIEIRESDLLREIFDEKIIASLKELDKKPILKTDPQTREIQEKLTKEDKDDHEKLLTLKPLLEDKKDYLERVKPLMPVGSNNTGNNQINRTIQDCGKALEKIASNLAYYQSKKKAEERKDKEVKKEVEKKKIQTMKKLKEKEEKQSQVIDKAIKSLDKGYGIHTISQAEKILKQYPNAKNAQRLQEKINKAKKSVGIKTDEEFAKEKDEKADQMVTEAIESLKTEPYGLMYAIPEAEAILKRYPNAQKADLLRQQINEAKKTIEIE